MFTIWHSQVPYRRNFCRNRHPFRNINITEHMVLNRTCALTYTWALRWLAQETHT